MGRWLIASAALGAAGLSAGCIPQTSTARDAGAGRSATTTEPTAAQKHSYEPAPAAQPAPRAPIQSEFTFLDGQFEQGGWVRGRVPSGTASAKLGDTELKFDNDGYFFAAFDRDEGSSVKFVATTDDGRRTIGATRPITPRNWNIEHINVARRAGGASDTFMQRRQPELDAIWNARLKDTGSEGWKQDFIWPATGRISGRFGSQRIYRGEPGSYHSGLDIAGGNGTTYVAPADGVVVLAVQGFSLEGNLLIIDHGQGLNSAFLHSSELFVRDGQAVKQGQPLGRIGASGRATGPHLHWSIKWHNSRLDPLLFLPPMP